MGNAKRDGNYVPTLIGVSSADLVTPVAVAVDPITRRLLTSFGGPLSGLSDVSFTGVAQGDLIYYDGTNWVNLAHGTSGQFLKTQGAGANPVWADVSVTVPGSDKQVIFNDGGSLGADAGFVYDKATDTATIGTLLLTNALAVAQGGTGATTASGARTALGLGTIATQDASNVTITGGSITGLSTLELATAGKLGTAHSAGNTLLIGAWDVDGAAFTTFITLTANNAPTCDLASGVTLNGIAIADISSTQTLSGKTLTAPKIANAGFIADANGNEQIIFNTTASAVNEITLTNAATGNNPTIAASGGDSVVDLAITPKGTNGAIVFSSPTKLVAPTVDGTCVGPSTRSFNSGYSSTAVGDLVYLDSSATWQKTDANTTALFNGLLGIALEVAASGSPVHVALPGSFVYATAFPTWTVGGPIYMSETAGAMTQTAPTTTDSATRIMGHAIHADKMYFNPDNAYITHT